MEKLEASSRPQPCEVLLAWVACNQANPDSPHSPRSAHHQRPCPQWPRPQWPHPPGRGPAPIRPRLPLRLPPAGAWGLHPAAAENRGGCGASSAGGRSGAARPGGGRCPREPLSPPLPAPRPYPLGVRRPPGTGPRPPPGPRGGVPGQHLPRLVEQPRPAETPPCLDPGPTSG